MNTFGERLRAAREARGLTQQALGFDVGVTDATISKWEKGRSEPTLAQLAMLAELLGVTTDKLIRNVAFWTGLAEEQGLYQAGHLAHEGRRVSNEDEETLLVRFRAATVAKRAAIIELLKP